VKEQNGVKKLEGVWRNNKLVYGECKYKSGSGYKGEWLDGKAHGKGVKMWRDGKKYDGMFRIGRPWGIGKKIFEDGKEVEGYWEKDRFVEK
jgi:hypothetical protein